MSILKVNTIDSHSGSTLTIDSTADLIIASTTTSTSNTTGALKVAGGISTAENLYVGGNAVITGTMTANGGTITLGDANTDNITFGGEINSDVIPDATNTYDLGSSAKKWAEVHATTLTGAVTGNSTTATALATGRTIAQTGDVVWSSGSFDGSANVTAVATIQANAVDSAEITAGAIDLAHMSANSVDSTQYVDGSIDLAHMSANSVDSTQYVDGSIDLAHMSANSVDSPQYVDGSIDLVHMSVNSIDSDQYVDGSIDTAHIANDAITTALIADDVALGGNPTTTTQSASNNSTRVATTAYADAAAAALVDSAPSTLDTLNELAAALGDDASFSTTVTNSIATKMPLAGGAFSGAVTTNSTFDGRDVAADGVTADAALPKAGGAMTGAITTNSTFDGVDIATRDAILTSTTTTAGAALPKAGGAMTGAITTNSTFDTRDVATDGTKLDTIETSATADQTDEEIQDIVGAMVSSNTESGVTVTYQDSDGTLDFSVASQTDQNFTNADHTKLDGIETAATADQTAAQIKTHLEDGIDSVHYVDGSIDLAHMSANSVDSAQYVDGSIDTAHIAADQITSALIADDQIDSEHYVDGSIDTAHIADDAVTTAKIADNVTLGGNVTVSGNLTVSGDTTTINTATLEVEDPLISLASGNNSSDAVDIGMYGLYDTSGSQDLYGGLFRDASDGKWRLFKDNQAVPTTTVNTSGTGYAVGSLVANLEGAVTGNADTATALATGRTIASTGDVVWTSASFTGSGNVTGTATIQANAVDSAEITAGSIDLAHMSVNSIDSPQYVDGSIDLAHMSANSVDSAQYVDGSIDTIHIADDAVTAAKLANSINTEIAANTAKTGITSGQASAITANTAKVTNATHSGEVTGSGALTIADNIVDEANLKISNAPTDGYVLSAESANTGGLTWAAVSTSAIGDNSVTYSKIQDVTATNRILGRDSAGSGIIEEITPANLLTMLGVETAATADQSASEIKTLLENGIDSVHYVDGSIDNEHLADDSVTVSKLNLISTSSVPSIEARSDGSIDGYIQLNCTANTHGIKLKSPPHSAAANYTLTFPTTDGNANEFLQSNGSGVMTWATADSDEIAAGAIDLAHMSVNSIDSDQYVDGSIDTAHIANDQITNALMADDAIDSAQIADNVTLGGNVTVSGNLTISGDTTTVNTATLAVEDPLISLATGNNGADAVDIGMYGLYDTSGSQDLYGGLFRDASDSGKWKLFKDNQAAPTTTVNTSGTGYAVGTLVANLEGNLTAANSVDSAQYVDGSIDVAHMSANSIDSDQYVDGSIDTAHYAAGSVDTTALGADCVTAAKIGNDVLNSEHYVAGSIDAEHIASEAVTTVKIAGGNITQAKMAANSVDSAQYVDGSIDLIHMSANSVDSDQYVDDSIDAAHLANSINTDIATGVTGNTTANAALPKAGGAMTGAITTNSTFDGVDIATRDAVLTSTINKTHVQSSQSSSTTTTINLDSSNNHLITLGTNTTLALSNTANNVGVSGNIILQQDSTGGRTVALPSVMKTPLGGASISFETGANTVSALSYYVVSSTVILVNYIGNFA
jgi:hypothetical protein